MADFRPTKKKRSLEDQHPSHALMKMPATAMVPPRHSITSSPAAVILGHGEDSADTMTTITTTPSSTGAYSYQSHWQILHLEQQVNSLQAELDHERAGRALDAKRNRHAVERAEAQAALHIREADTARELLRETTQQSDERIQQLTRDRDQALHQNRQLRLQLEQHLEDAEQPDEEAQEQWQRENERLRDLLVQRAASEEALRHQVAEWKEQTARQLEQLKNSNMPNQEAPVQPLPLLEEAPSAILKELSKTRLELAEAERRNRQLERDRNELQQRNRTLVCDVEKYKQHSQRLDAVEKEWHQNRAQFETAQAEQAGWREFLQQLHRVIPSLKNNSSGPLEVATVIRFLETHKRETTAALQSVALLKQECEQLKRELLVNSKTSSVISDESAFQQQKREWEVRLANIQQQLETAQQQALLYQREADSLRTLMQTFEAQMIHSNKNAAATTTGPVQQALELQLKTAQEQVKVLQTKYDDICTTLETSRSKHIASQQELERVKEKFGKLRDALMVEKQKVTTAEERANAAEELAGKGAFNPERTRVLHLTETPLVQALKEEVAVLKRQLAERHSVPGGGDTSHGLSSSLAPNPDKLNQRLKENFKEQIALFREGVYLMTGFKVDMIPTADTGRPTFRLRSVYAEQEEDHLLLQWPKDQDKSKVTALDILNTDFAKKLTKTPAYEYMTKFHSLPAFLASCQLNLFDNQTIML